MDYLKDNHGELSLDSNLSVISGKRGSPIKNTSAKRIVEYILKDLPMSSQPPGYHVFIKKVMQDDYLKQNLLSAEVRDMYQKLKGNFGRGAINSIKKKNSSGIFKPKLW